MSLRPIGLALLSLVAATGGPAVQPTAGQRPTRAAGDSVAITDVTILDVLGGPRQPGMTVLIKGHEITAIGRGLAIPREAVRVDGTGRFLIPGFWDMHAHQQMTGMESLDLYLANGVVGTRDMGSDPDYILPLRDRINRGEVFGPEIVAAGPILDLLRPEGPLAADLPAAFRYFALMRRRVADAQQAREAVTDLKRRGVDFIKVHDTTPREAFLAIAEEVKKTGLTFAGHVPNAVTVREAAAAGIKSIEHLANFRVFRDCSGPEHYSYAGCKDFFDWIAMRGVWQTPTIAFSQAIPDIFSGQPLPHAEYASDGLLESTRGNAEFSRLDERALAAFRSNNRASLAAVRDLVARGNRLLAACDGLVPGFCLHDELEWMTKAGLPPIQALQAATINPAMYLGREKAQGTIAVGMRADLVLLEADPLADIRHTRRIASVVVRGRLLTKADTERMLAARKRASRRG